ncbi:hypothetical protein FJ657_06815 [Schumannella soli]|uniref:Squalene cyclase C-terminal domain-containing protein n=1 Tax=Schumannella soli TaxID=2590779 RepID=A0A506Y863_9MICO|nr:hypothetical protein FJ657_06815 [Schumannella soli]
MLADDGPDAADPAVRWQALRDLSDAAPVEVAGVRARASIEGWGDALLARQEASGDFGGVGDEGERWRYDLYSLIQLRLLRPDPADARIRSAIELVRDRVTWGPWHAESPFFSGETEPCINGNALAIGAYFSGASESADGLPIIEGTISEPLAARLLGEQLPDGGWNCEAPDGSAVSSFHSTICVLDGLLEYELAGGVQSADAIAARHRAEQYLLERRLFLGLRSGEVVDAAMTHFEFPYRWRYDVLRGLDHFVRAYPGGAATVGGGAAAGGGAAVVGGAASGDGEVDARLAPALDLLERRRGLDGRWTLGLAPGGEGADVDAVRHFGEEHEYQTPMESGGGAPSRWNTFRALRALRWAGRG